MGLPPLLGLHFFSASTFPCWAFTPFGPPLFLSLCFSFSLPPLLGIPPLLALPPLLDLHCFSASTFPSTSHPFLASHLFWPPLFCSLYFFFWPPTLLRPPTPFWPPVLLSRCFPLLGFPPLLDLHFFSASAFFRPPTLFRLTLFFRPPTPFGPPFFLSLYFSFSLPPLFRLCAVSWLQRSEEEEEVTACCHTFGVWLGRIPFFSFLSRSMSVPLAAGRRWCTRERRLSAARARCPYERRQCRAFARSLLNASCARSVDLPCI